MTEPNLPRPDLAAIEPRQDLPPEPSSGMTKRRLFLHIGLPKTGTSYIQSLLGAHRPTLLEQGILYPNTGTQASNHKLLAIPFLSEARKERPDVRPCLDQKLTRLWFKLRDEIHGSDASRIVLSSEYFSEAVALRLLRRIFDRLDVEVAIIVYLRRQDRLIESGYNQEIKAGLQTAKVDWNIAYCPEYDYERLLDRWAEAFGATSLLVQTFEDAVAGPGILRDFLRRVGADLDVPDGAAERNEALHPGLIEFRRIENVIDLTGSRLINLANPLLRKLDPRPGLSLMSAEHRQRFRSFYTESNARVARRYLGRDDGVLFAAPEGETTEDSLDAEVCLSVILSCAYNDMVEKIARAERQSTALQAAVNNLRTAITPLSQLAALQAEVNSLRTEVTSLRRVEKELDDLRTEIEALRARPSLLRRLIGRL